MFKISTYLNQLGLLKSILLHERLLKEKTELYCIVENRTPLLDADQLLDHVSIFPIRRKTIIIELKILIETIIYLYKNSLSEIKSKERQYDIELDSDFLSLAFDNTTYEFYIYFTDTNQIEEHQSKSYYDLIENDIPHYFIELKEIINRCHKLRYNLELLYPKLKIKDLKDLYRDNYGIHHPNDYPHDYLKYFMNFKYLNLENMEVLPTAKIVDKIPGFSQEIIEKNLHNEIFVGDSILKFEICLKEFDITNKSRTDVKFIFEKMKAEKLIHATVKQADFLKWLAETHDLSVEKTSNFNPTINRENLYKNAHLLYQLKAK